MIGQDGRPLGHLATCHCVLCRVAQRSRELSSPNPRATPEAGEAPEAPRSGVSPSGEAGAPDRQGASPKAPSEAAPPPVRN